MRISSQTFYDSNVSAMNQQQARLLQIQQQVASGRRLLSASDDPVAAARALNIGQSDAINTQHQSNRSAARHTLSMAESSMHGVVTLLQDVKTTAVYAGNPGLNVTDRRTLANELSGRLQELIGLANSTDGSGNYLFAGFQTRIQPFVEISGMVTYNGDDGERLMQVNSSRQMSASQSGADIFMRVRNGISPFSAEPSAANTGSGIIGQGVAIDSHALTGDTYLITYEAATAQAAPGNTGTGVVGTPVVINPSAVSGKDYSVTINMPASTYDVNELTVGYNSQMITTLDFTSPGTFVVDVAGDNVAVTLDGAPFADEDALVAKIQTDLDASVPGSYEVTSTGSVIGGNFSVSIARTAAGSGSTAVSISGADAGAAAGGIADSAGVPGGASVLSGQTFASGQAISFDGLLFTIQGNPANGDSFTITSPGLIVTDTDTGEVVLPTPPATGHAPFASGQAFNFDGIQFDIQGQPADGDTFMVSSNASESVFETISGLIAALNAPVTSVNLSYSLSHAIAWLDNAMENVLSVQSSMGVRLNELDALQSEGEDINLQHKQALSELLDLDYNKAISDLVQQQTNLQAAQKTFSKVAGLSLFDYL